MANIKITIDDSEGQLTSKERMIANALSRALREAGAAEAFGIEFNYLPRPRTPEMKARFEELMAEGRKNPLITMTDVLRPLSFTGF